MASGFEILTVSQLLRYVKSLLEGEKQLADVMVQGEISNLSVNSASGHIYFSLKDNMGLIRCVMFRRCAQTLRETPAVGTTVLVRGGVTLYERDSAFQIVAYDIQTLGAGVQSLSFDALKNMLLAEGLFAPEHKLPLPAMPGTVGVITSRDGAALHDVTETFRLHNPAVRLIVYPAAVQGAGAPAAIIAALDLMEREGLCDCVILARGGGSSEDLSAFNNEALARRVYACRVPVISAVGHEVDITILDFVADARAATPTAAVRLAAPSLEEIVLRIGGLEERITAAMNSLWERRKTRLDDLTRLLRAYSPRELVEKNRQTLDYLIKLLVSAEQRRLTGLSDRLCQSLETLQRLNPAALMARGYTITTRQGQVLGRCDEPARGELLTTVFAGGEITSSVVSFVKKEEV